MRDLKLPEPIWCEGVGRFFTHYRGYVVDQWGVMHDGTRPYPGAIECLERLVGAGCIVVMLSNSGRRAAPNAERIAAFGFGPRACSAIVTSGEVVWQKLRHGNDPQYRALGRRCLLFSSNGDRSLLEGLDLEQVADVADASFILLAGIDDDMPPDALRDALERGARRGLPLVCANPDRVRIASGGLVPSCGALAHQYELMGGHVLWVGKPHPAVYEACRDIFARGGVHEIVAIGDSIQHDVVGGAEAGFDTAFVTQGIHRDEFAPDVPFEQRNRRLHALGDHYGVRPDWVIETLRW